MAQRGDFIGSRGQTSKQRKGTMKGCEKQFIGLLVLSVILISLIYDINRERGGGVM